MRLVRYRTEAGGCVHAVAGNAGRIYTQLVWIDAPIRVARVPNGDVERYAVAYDRVPLKRAARTMLRAGKRLGITKGAKRLLREAINGA